MEILRSYPENMDKRSEFKLTNSKAAQKLSNAAGSVLPLDKWILYTDIDIKTGELQKVLTIESGGEVFATVSKTFIDSFEKAADFFKNDIGEIEVIPGTSKAGRDYIDCQIV